MITVTLRDLNLTNNTKMFGMHTLLKRLGFNIGLKSNAISPQKNYNLGFVLDSRAMTCLHTPNGNKSMMRNHPPYSLI